MSANFVEEAVLVDEQNNVLGTLDKSKVHGRKTPLHRGFSIFIFNSKGEVLTQQRSHTKQTWPGVWSNSCCGHPKIHETNEKAAERRLKEELGMEASDIQIIENYRYCFSRDGIMENEICPILIGFSEKIPIPNKNEVENFRFIPWNDFLNLLKKDTQKIWSEWCKEETFILDRNPKFHLFLKKHVKI